MKKLYLSFVFLVTFTSILCSYESCADENDFSKCTSHNIEIDDFSCYQSKIKIFNIEQNTCIPYPDNPNVQKQSSKILSGITKEFHSGAYYYNDGTVPFFIEQTEKETYSKGEIIIISNGTLTEDDKRIIVGNNTCLYQFYGRFMENVHKGSFIYPDITNENTCFNVDQFNDLKNLINCGYSETNYTYKGKNYSIRTCYIMPDDYMEKTVEQSYLKLQKLSFESFLEVIADYNDKYGTNSLSKKLNILNGLSKKRQLDDDLKYEMIIKDKNEKKLNILPTLIKLKL